MITKLFLFQQSQAGTSIKKFIVKMKKNKPKLVNFNLKLVNLTQIIHLKGIKAQKSKFRVIIYKKGIDD